MRILAVRGRNLASLPRFDVQFDDGPDAPGHLIAIVGPTGAGKSTLLDAVCLALYDRAPRLLGAREVAVDKNEAHGHDPRAIMRRGAADSQAEVDLVGFDREVYRATWEAWRAHRRSDGRLQAQRLSLIHLPSGRELTGATKTETLASIQELVGLSFDEFRRAVLLAQGDFSAFLNARADERAELLEKMTGTHVYGEISRRAFERARAEDEALAGLERKVSDLSLLSDEGREALASDVEALRTERARVEARLEAAKAAFQWFETDAALVREVEEAEAAAARAEAERRAAEPEAEALAIQTEAERLRPVLERTRAAAREHADAKTARRICAKDAEAAERNHRAAHTHEEETAHRLAHAEARLKESEAQLAEARKLEGVLEGVDLERSRVQGELERLGDLMARAETRLEAKQTAYETARRRHDDIARWIRKHPAEARVAASWDRWAEELARLSRNRGSLEEVVRRLANLDTELDAATNTTGNAHRDAETAREEEAQCDRVRAAREAEALRLRSESSGPDLRRALERTAEERAALDEMERTARSVRRHHRKKTEEARHAAREQALALEAEERLAAVDARKRRIETELEGATGALSTLRTHLDLASRRPDLLRAGEPCPLCGSAIHPAAGDPSPDDTQLSGLAAAVRSLAAELDVVRTDARTKASAREEHRRAAAEAELRKAEHTRAVDEEVEAYRLRRERLSMLWIDSPVLARSGVGRIASMLPESPHRTSPNVEIDAARRALDTLRGELLERAEAIDAAAAALEQATARADTARRQREVAEENKRRAQTALESLSRAREEKILEQRRLSEEHGSLVGRLSEAFEGWGDLGRLATAPQVFLEEAAQRVDHFATLEQEAQLLGEAVVQSLREGEVARTQRDARGEAQQAAAARLAECRNRRARISGQRNALFDGRPAAEVEAQLEANLRTGRAAFETARRDREQAAERWAEARARLGSARQRETELGAECEAAEAELSEAIRGSSLADEADLARALDHRPEERDRLATRIAALTERETETRTTLEDRRRRLEGYRADAPPESSRAEATKQIEVNRNALFAVTDRLATLQVHHAHDEEARKKARSLAAKLAEQHERTRRWAELSTLIGSADGRKFRTFAQSFTLELLLEQANLHLTELRPRYHLRRVPERDMDMFVEDRDLGDEPRPISTLSGGERFLVSLALALGLSSLSSKSVRLDSLFIDEGFGALDRDSLETALAVLDQLQAEGRTVGLISHVADLAERVVDRVEIHPVSPGTSEVRTVRGS